MLIGILGETGLMCVHLGNILRVIFSRFWLDLLTVNAVVVTGNTVTLVTCG